jgi:hypothetical protein
MARIVPCVPDRMNNLTLRCATLYLPSGIWTAGVPIAGETVFRAVDAVNDLRPLVTACSLSLRERVIDSVRCPERCSAMRSKERDGRITIGRCYVRVPPICMLAGMRMSQFWESSLRAWKRRHGDLVVKERKPGRRIHGPINADISSPDRQCLIPEPARCGALSRSATARVSTIRSAGVR